MSKLKTYFNWSTGKDASLALYYLQQQENVEVAKLLTSINNHFDRVSMHGLRRSLLEKQVQALGISATTIELPEQPTMEEYEKLMTEKVSQFTAKGYTHTAFGDIFLEDLRKYREAQLQPFNIKCLFPLWEKNTKDLLLEFIDLGFKAITVCTKAKLLDETFVGRTLDRNFLNDLPKNVDPCGENGEFHTFCYEGPIFKNPVLFKIGEKIYREYKTPKNNDNNVCTTDSHMGFWFCDLLPL